METKKKFIVKFAITVFLLAVLFFEVFFLYCRYVKHTSALTYAAEKLHIAQDWVAHSGAQTANAQTPASRKVFSVKSAASQAFLFPTAENALRETLKRRHTLAVSANSDDTADSAQLSENATAKDVPSENASKADASEESGSAKKSPPEENATPPPTEEAALEASPANAEEANPAGTETTDIRDLLKRQEKAGLASISDNRVQLEAESILQNPELPTGCEVTSLTMALRFAGYDVSKEELADQFLDKAPPGSVSYKSAFWGDPRQAESFGCYAPVIVKAANKYLASQKSEKTAYNLTGASLDDLLSEVRMGYPVIVWGSMYIDEEIVFSYGWDIEGETVTWPSNEHCMLLVGFDLENNSVIVCDPLNGTVSYDKGAFQRHYETLEQQAIVIY